MIFNLGFFVPIIPILVSCLLSSYELKTKSNPLKRRDNSKRHATITIICFTLIYALFNIPRAIWDIMLTVDYYCDWRYDFSYFDRHHYHFVNFMILLSVSINSAMNPLLYFWRMGKLRSHSARIVSRSMSMMYVTYNPSQGGQTYNALNRGND